MKQDFRRLCIMCASVAVCCCLSESGHATPRRSVGQRSTATIVSSATPRARDEMKHSAPDDAVRPASVADAVQMTRFGDPYYVQGGASKGIVAKFSPDGKQFVTVIRKGNLQNNTNEYSLLLFVVAKLFQSQQPRVLLSLASSSNRPAIYNPIWLNDSDTIYFAGEGVSQQAQIYTVKCSSGEVRQLTNHPTNITAFASSAEGKQIAYIAESTPSSFVTPETLQRGIRIKHERLWDLIRESSGGDELSRHEFFIHDAAIGEDRRVRLEGEIAAPNPELTLSPDGRYAVVQTEVTEIPDFWRDYQDQFVQLFTRHPAAKGVPTGVFQYEVVDMLTGESKALLGTPCSGLGSKAAWSPDSKSVVISGAYLPLTADKPAEREERKAQTFLVEVRIPSREFVAISKENLRLVKWEARTGSVVCERNQNSAGKGPSEVSFRKDREKWLEVGALEKTAPSLPEIALDEDMNNAPQMVVVDSATGRRSLVMDLNPQFKYLTFAKVENIVWTDKLGNKVSGGLYWPPNYVPGKRYSLIIQTHGWNAAKFWIDGPFATAFAAQALANKGFFVLQDPGPDWHALETPDEGPRATASYEGAIDYLDGRHLIDRKRVGIVGFSRTCYHVTFALTHSKYQFAAAVIADGIDAGYFQHLVFSNAIPDVATDSDALNGAAPFGEGLGDWIRRAPPFLADRVRTPLLIQAIGPASLLGEWEWFARLTRINKPVDLIYIPHGTHLLEKPWERMLSEQSSVDWFCFWLEGQENLDLGRADQYVRWRELRSDMRNLGTWPHNPPGHDP